jgi:hypothetical protein
VNLPDAQRARRRSRARAAEPRTFVALLLCLGGLLAACPLPQPLAEVSVVDGGSVAPPRILVASVLPPQTRIAVSRSCTSTPIFVLQAQVDDPDAVEPVEARWFVDYDVATNVGLATPPQTIPGTGDPAVTVRPTPASFTYGVPPVDPANSAHVVELVVSNGFAPAGVTVPLPNRTAASGFETQVFRWIFQYVDDGGACRYP